MNIITRNNLNEYYGRVFTLNTFRDSFSNVAITTGELTAVVNDILGRTGDDKGTFSNLKNMNKLMSDDELRVLRDKFNYYITNNYLDVFIQHDEDNKYKLGGEKNEMMNSTVKVLAENGILNVLDSSFGSVLVKKPKLQFEKLLIKEPEIMQEKVLQGDKWAWVIVIFASLCNTYVVGCVEEAKKLISPFVNDKEHCTSGRLLAGLTIDKTGLAEESDFWKRVNQLKDEHPTDRDAMTFNDEQKEKFAWHIHCMKIDGRLAPDIEKLSDNDIVRIILDMDKSSFLNGMDKEKLEYYRDLAERYANGTATNANPQYIYGVTPMR